MSQERGHANNLKRAVGLSKKIPGTIQSIQQTFSLWQQIRIFDMPFLGIALSAALLKDILDFTGLGSLPFVGTVVTLIASIMIAASLFAIAIDNLGAIKKGSRFVSGNDLRKVGALVGGTLLEMIFGLDFLPVETLMTIYIFRLVLIERKMKSEAAETNKKAHQTQPEGA